jgi:hypothetical protein
MLTGSGGSRKQPVFITDMQQAQRYSRTFPFDIWRRRHLSSVLKCLILASSGNEITAVPAC